MFLVAGGAGLTAAFAPTGRVTGTTAFDVDGPELLLIKGGLRTAPVVAVKMLLALELWIVFTIAAVLAADGLKAGFVIVAAPGLNRLLGIVSKNGWNFFIGFIGSLRRSINDWLRRIFTGETFGDRKSGDLAR